jgi:multidrug transporter EmrE-like cation transporter
MHVIFAIARFFPYIALAFCFAFYELGRHLRRKSNQFQYSCWAAIVLLAILSASWFVFRGDLHSDEWIRYLFQM